MINPFIVEIREQLWNETARLAEESQCKGYGLSIGRRLAALWEEFLVHVWNHELQQIQPAKDVLGSYALLALGGFGWGIIAPYSDIDLVLFTPRRHSQALCTLAAHFYRDVYDLGWQVGFSTHTTRTLARQLTTDPHFLTAALQARLLHGDLEVFNSFHHVLQKMAYREGAGLIKTMIRSRAAERDRYGETVYILQPNIKRSPGGIRDIQLIHWIRRFEELRNPSYAGLLTPDEQALVAQAEEFLWGIRQWLHWHAGRSHDILTRSDQWRLAATWGYCEEHSLLPAEVFMRDYFRKTECVYFLVERLSESYFHEGKRTTATSSANKQGYLIRQGNKLTLTVAGQKALSEGWPVLMECLATSQRWDLPLGLSFWDEVFRRSESFSAPLPSSVLARFGELFHSGKQLANILRGLHKVRLLERFIPAFEHARGLLQFNQYHHYTVDEHCMRAVEIAARFGESPGIVGETYRRIAQKRILHLALLLHDLGKGLGPDHSEVGRAIARETSDRLGLSAEESQLVEYLVASHLRMNHLALRRDLSDEQLIVQFAAEVGSPETLQLLYVLTVADLMAVSPDNWTAWKADLLAELFQRTARYISDSGDIVLRQGERERRREAVAEALGSLAQLPFFAQQLAALPDGYLLTNEPCTIAADLRWLASLGDAPVDVHVEYRAENSTLLWAIATREDVASGIFHRLTGALSSQGLEILAAQINTFADGWILDKYVVRDPYFDGPPPPDRLETIRQVIRRSLLEADFRPAFPKRWEVGRPTLRGVPPARVRVEIDNHSLPDFTIIEVFANDRPGLLYEIARFIYQAGCFVWRAKIGTFLDQVVDVFYVTTPNREKITSEERIRELRDGLLAILQKSEVS